MKQPTSIILTSISLLWLPLLAAAQQTGLAQAEAIARHHWANYKASNREAFALKSQRLELGDMPCYVISRNTANGRATLPGYMLVAAAGDMPATLLAYDDSATFATGNLPEHIASWLNGYKTMIPANADERRQLQAWLEASQTAHPGVPPLLGNREWGQDSPYNLLCPTIEGKRCPTGCVATALAQIMCCHQWPLTGSGTTTYDTSTKGMQVIYDFGNTSFDWDSMQDTYSPVVDMFDDDDQIASANKYYVSSIGIDASSEPGEKCYVNVNGFMVMGFSSFEGEVLLLIIDGRGHLKARGSSAVFIESRNSGHLFSSKSFMFSVPMSLTDGSYRVYCAARTTSAAAWQLADIWGKGKNYVEFTKKGEHFFLDGISYPCRSSNENVRPVATLMQAVGAAVKMDYNLGGSGSNDTNVLTGLTNFLGYDPDMFFAYPENYTDQQWHELLQEELAQGRPVYYTGQGVEGGHAFVIDGFETRSDSVTYYHVNWGWDGLCNGYYLLNMLRPSTAGTGGTSGTNYSNSPSMLIGMQPDDGQTLLSMTCMGMQLLQNDFFPTCFMPLRIDKLAMQSSQNFSGQLLITAVSAEGADYSLYEQPVSITAKRGLTNHFISFQLPSWLQPGTYELRVECIGNDGTRADIACSKWPTITIRDSSEWTGGPLTQPLQFLGLAGETSLTADAGQGKLTLTIDSLVNPQSVYASGQMAIVIVGNTGSMLVQPIQSMPISLAPYGVTRQISLSTHISRYMPDGSYQLRLAFLPSNDTLWTYCDRLRCEGSVWWASFEPYFVSMTMVNGTAFLPDMTVMPGADSPWTAGIDAPLAGILEEYSPCYELLGRKTRPQRHGVYITRKGRKNIKIIK